MNVGERTLAKGDRGENVCKITLTKGDEEGNVREGRRGYNVREGMFARATFKANVIMCASNYAAMLVHAYMT